VLSVSGGAQGRCRPPLKPVSQLPLLLPNLVGIVHHGWRKGWKRLWKDKTEGGFKKRSRWTSISSRQDPPAPQVEGNLLRQSWSHCGRLQLGHPRVSHRRGARVGRERVQGSEGEEDHSKTSPAGDPWRRGVGHIDQGNDCWRRSHPPHSQVADWQEGRGHPASPVEILLSANSTKSSKLDNLALVGQI